MRRRVLVLVIIMGGIGILSGCATTRPGFDDVQTLVHSRAGVRIHWDQGGVEDAEVREVIDSMLNEKLTMDGTLQIALLNNSSLQATYEDLGIAQADLVQAGLLENPVFEASVRFPDASGEGTNTEFSVAHNFLDIFMVPLKRKVAEEQFEQTKLLVGDAVLNLTTEVKVAYYELQASEQMLAMRRNVLKANHAAQELAKRQRDAGNINDLVFSMHASAYHKAKLEVDRHELEVLGLRENLSRLMEIPHDKDEWKIVPGLPFISTGEASLEELQSLAMEKRLDLAAAEKEIQVLEKSLELARWGVIPQVEAGVNTEREPDRTQLTGPVFGIEIPIFDQKQQPIKRTQAELRRSEKRLAAMKREIQSQVKVARSELIMSRKAVQSYQETIVPLHERIVQLTQE